MEIKHFIPSIGDICMVELVKTGFYNLYGKHLCIIYDIIGSKYMVAPITNNDTGKIYWCEYPVEKGRCGLYKNSKIKLDELKAISKELILYKFNKADIEILKAISDFLIVVANKIVKQQYS